MRSIPICVFLLSGCVASQEIGRMHRELTVQVGRIQESIDRDATARRDALKKVTESSNKALSELREALTQQRAGFEQQIGALNAKIAELLALVADLKKGVRVPGSASLAELEVRAVGENHYRISRKQFSEHTYELLRLLTTVALAANFDGEKLSGVRIVEGNALLERFGILAGDVVVKVAEKSLASEQEARKLFRTVWDAQKVPIVVRRGRQTLNFLVTIAE
jgi:hypothetical protein